MKYVFEDISNIESIITKKSLVLLLDFDLTLSPLAKNPIEAFLPESTKNLLKQVLKNIPVIIVTGRKLDDIRKRVNIRGMSYVGNHGLEYFFNKKIEVLPVSTSAKKALRKLKNKLVEKCKGYDEIILEDKKYSLSLGYRLVKSHKSNSLERVFRNIQNEIKKDCLLETRLDKKTFEIRPKTNINKGTACSRMLKIIRDKLKKKITPLYIGDSETDEDAFKILKKTGITVRVGKNTKSQAEGYLQNQKEVNYFLEWVLSA